MKIIKSLLKKNDDPYIALMIYCSTPLYNGFSFSDLLMNRQLHTTSPILESQLQPPYQNMVLSVRRDNEKSQSKKIFVIEQIPYTWNFSQHVYFTVEHETRIFAVEISRIKVIQKFSRFSHLATVLCTKNVYY